MDKDVEKFIKDISERVSKIELICQDLGNRVDKLENGEYGTGVYLDGCNEADIEYITDKSVKKEHE